MIETGFQRPKYLECDYETLTDTYGKFSAQPFERGYGITIGNALRRILLSSITGTAISNVRIQGVLHEFSTLPGVVEDVTDIVLNVKSIPLKMDGDEPKTLTLKKEGPDEATAADIVGDGDVEILNKEVHIASLDKDGKFLALAGGDGTARVFLLSINDLIDLAKTRLTRMLTEEECQKYLHQDSCPEE